MRERSKSNREITRREFVKAAAAAPILASGLSVGRSAWAGGGDALRVGLVGCGGRGTGAALQALRADPGAVLVAMADVFPERIATSLGNITNQMGERAAQQVQVFDANQCTGFDGCERVLEADLDVILLATPPAFRPAHMRAAVDAGVHMFTEKPMAVDAPGLRVVRQACEDAKVKNLNVVSGFCWRYGDAERATFKRVHEGAVGRIISVHTTYHTSTLSKRPRQPQWSDMEWQLRNWWHFCWLSGDHIVEQACHSIDKLAWAMNDETPARCIALGGRAAREGAESGDVYDHFTAIYEYADGRRCFHTCRQIDRCPSDNSDYIYGTDGAATVNGWTPTHDIRDHDGNLTWRYDGPRRDMYQNEHDALFAAIRSGKPINDGPWMCNSVMMAIMARMAAYTGQTIGWEQAWDSQERLGPETYAMGDLPVGPVPVPGRTRFR